MIKIEVYRLFDKTVATVQSNPRMEQRDDGAHTIWQSLSYVSGPPLAHSETHQLSELVQEAIEEAEEHAAALGGWSTLV